MPTNIQFSVIADKVVTSKLLLTTLSWYGIIHGSSEQNREEYSRTQFNYHSEELEIIANGISVYCLYVDSMK